MTKNQFTIEELTPSEKEAILIQVKDLINSDRLLESYIELRGDKNVLMAKVYPKTYSS
jgi:hypothetical protein